MTHTIQSVLLLIVIHTSSSQDASNSSLECDKWSQEHVYASSERHLSNITEYFLHVTNNLSELSIQYSCPDTKMKLTHITGILKIYAAHMAMYDNDIDMRNALEIFDMKKTFNIGKHTTIKALLFQNILGFNFNSANVSLYLAHQDFEIFFTQTCFDVYFHNQLIDEEMCHMDRLENLNINIFGSITLLSFEENTFYKNKLCPYVFVNTYLRKLAFSFLSESFIFKNKLEFLQLNTTSNIFLNRFLTQLSLNVYNYNLDSILLERNVFKNVLNLFLQGSLCRVDANVFAQLSNLRFIKITISSSLKDFFHSGTDWLLNLNLNIIESKTINFLDLVISFDSLLKTLNFSLYVKPTNTFSY